MAARLGRRPALLYGLLDTGLVPGPGALPELAAGYARSGVGLLQLRAKGMDTAGLERLARSVLQALEGTGVRLLLNDRVDVALAVGAHGAHVGAEDLEPAAARTLLGPDRILGVTAHDLSEVQAVDASVVDYLGFGAVFGTSTREGAAVCGPEALTAVVAASTVPVVAIGGIRPANVQALRGSGVSGVAVASALLPGRTRPGAVEEFLRALDDLD